MARQRLLGEAYWAAVFALPSEEREVVRHCTLTTDDPALVAFTRAPHLGSGHESALSVRLVRTEGQLRSEAA